MGAESIPRRGIADVTTDSQDRVYVLTREESRVCIYRPDGDLIRWWTHATLGIGVHGIAVDSRLNVYVVDWLDHCVRKFTEDGQLLATIGSPGHASDTGVEPWPPKHFPYPVERLSHLHGAGPFNGCTKLAFGPTGDIYVSDGYGNARIHHFDKEGGLLESWGNPGSGPSEFHNPHGVSFGPDGLMYVADRENDRIQVFTADFRFVRSFSVQRPAAAAIGNDGRIAVACLRYAADEDTFTRGRVTELVADRLVVLDDQGRLLFETEKPVSVPNGIAMDSRGDIYVAHVTRYHRVNEESSLEAARTATGSSIPKFRRLN